MSHLNSLSLSKVEILFPLLGVFCSVEHSNFNLEIFSPGLTKLLFLLLSHIK